MTKCVNTWLWWPLLAVAVLFAPMEGWPDSGETASAANNSPSVLIQTSPVQEVRMTETLTTYGTVEFSPEYVQAMDVMTEVMVNQVFVAAGQRVRRGDALLSLRATANAQLELERARIDVTFSEKNAVRLRDLLTRQLATNAEVQAAEQNLSRDQAILAGIQKRLGGKIDRVLSADMDGVVDAVNVRQGDIAAPGTPLVRIAKEDRLRVRLGVEAEDIRKIKTGQSVQVMPVYVKGTAVTGQITQVYQLIDPKTHLIEVVVPLPTAPDILPGTMVRGDIVLQTRNTLAIPRSAVLYERGGKAYVFVNDKGQARRRGVDIGHDDGRYVEILGGLVKNERVVSLGNYELTNGMRVRTQGGHQ